MAEPSVNTTSKLNSNNIKIMGASQIFFLTRINIQNSFKISSLLATAPPQNIIVQQK